MTLPDAEARRAALVDFQRNLVVVAGAGTGKTSLLVGRLASALVRLHLEPHQVLALTFTDNAAAEMRARLVRLLRAVEPWLAREPIEASDRHVLDTLALGPEDLPRVRAVLDIADELQISTFHAWCGSLLRRYARRLDLPPELRADTPEKRAPAFAESFLAQLRAQSSPIHDALEAFDPKELRELARALLALPEDAIEARRRPPPPPDTAPLRATLAGVLAAWPKARQGFRDCVDALLDACDRLDAGAPPDRHAFPRTINRPGASVPAAERDGVVQAVEAVRDTLRPHVLADEDGIAHALDFLAPFLARHRREVLARGELTFDDVIFETRRHLMRDPALRRTAGEPLRAILVDEFQDTDPLQYDIVFLLAAQPRDGEIPVPQEAAPRDATLFLVGDPKQSIYRFRGADLAAFAAARAHVLVHGGARLDLVANFRSDPAVLAAVNHVGRATLVDEPPYQLGYEPVDAVREAGPAAVEIVRPAEADDLKAAERRDLEGRLVVALLRERREHGTPWSGMAVLLRAATDTSWLLRPLRAAGIPYVLEGSRRFYQRHEVVVATALLSALARPHDPVAVLGVLRSALSTATDAEILAWMREHGRHPLDYRGAQGDGPVGATLAWLEALHAEVSALPTDAAIEHVLGLDAWAVAEGGGYEGAQRLANLERLLHTLRRERPIDLAAAAEFVVARTTQETEDEESPLFDQGLDAVRVMTVHASKGLEFELVVVPDLVRRPPPTDPPADARVERAYMPDGRQVVGIQVGPSRNAASLLLDAEQRRHRAAEELRLLYVAMTRARRDLILIGGADAPRNSWQAALDGCGLAAHVHTRTVEVPPIERATIADAEVATTLAAWRAHETARARVALPEEPVAAEPHAVASVPGAPPPADATELGIAVHRYLALVSPRGPLDEALVAALDRPAFAGELARIAARFHDSPLRARIAAATRALREVPVAFVDAAGAPQHGVLDLLLEEGGAWTVVDHKTDRVATGAHAAAAEVHRAQLARYADGVRRALALPAVPATQVWFARDDVLVTLP